MVKTLLFVLVLAFLILSVPIVGSGDSGYEDFRGLRLDGLVGKYFAGYIVGRRDTYELARSIAGLVWDGSPPDLVKKNSIQVGENLVVDVYRGGDATLYVSEAGYVECVVGDGRSLPYMAYSVIDGNASLLTSLVKNITGIGDFRIVYAGAGSEKEVVGIIEKYYPNGTRIRSGPTTIYVDPYEKYYIVLDNLRIGYPVKIRGVDISTVKGSNPPRIQYLELVAPKILLAYTFSIGENTVKEIASIYGQVFKDNTDSSQLVIADTYYAFSRDKAKLLPTLKIHKQNTGNVIWIQLDRNKVVFLAAATFTSPIIGPDEPTININATNNAVNNHPDNTTEILEAIALITIIMSIIATYLLLKRR